MVVCVGGGVEGGRKRAGGAGTDTQREGQEEREGGREGERGREREGGDGMVHNLDNY